MNADAVEALARHLATLPPAERKAALAAYRRRGHDRHLPPHLRHEARALAVRLEKRCRQLEKAARVHAQVHAPG
jgi:hypothetical protein